MLCILEDHKTGVGAIIWAEEKSVSIEKVPLSCTHNSYTCICFELFYFKFLHVHFSYTHRALQKSHSLVTKLMTASLIILSRWRGSINEFSNYHSVSASFPSVPASLAFVNYSRCPGYGVLPQLLIRQPVPFLQVPLQLLFWRALSTIKPHNLWRIFVAIEMP